MECFQWSDTDYDLQHVKEELADVMVYCQDMLDALGLDEDEIINMKMDITDKNSYGRTRGFGLICAQARWDKEGKMCKAPGQRCRC